MDQDQFNQPSIETPPETMSPAPSVPQQSQINQINDSVGSKSVFEIIRQATAWVMIISAVSFALVGLLAIWQVFGSNAGDVVWRAFSSLAIIAFASLIVNVASRMVENKH